MRSILASRRIYSQRFLVAVLVAGAASAPVRVAAADDATDVATKSTPFKTIAVSSENAKTETAQPVMGTIEAPLVKAESSHPDGAVRLHRGLRERGVSFGFGQKIPYNRFDVRTDTTMFQVIPSKGRFRNSKQEFLWEAPLVVFTKPHTDFLAGLTLMFRQHLTSNRNFAPYIELGAGVNLTDLDVREVGGRFQFSLQGGVGVRKAIGKDSDLTVGLRWYHLSNAGLDVPNTGLNNYLVTVGYSHLM